MLQGQARAARASGAEKRALARYKAHTGDVRDLEPETKRKARSVIGRCRLPALTLHRGEWLPEPPAEGAILRRPGLLATSRSEQVVLDEFLLDPEKALTPHRHRVLARIECPAGTRGALLSALYGGYDPEQEVTLVDVALEVRRLRPDPFNLFRRAPLWHVDAVVADPPTG